jgi:hypothetical protein
MSREHEGHCNRRKPMTPERLREFNKESLELIKKFEQSWSRK